MQKNLLVVTNIPSPYRLHLFEHLFNECSQRDISFDVWFMAENEPGRHWPYDPNLCHFPHRLLTGIHPSRGGVAFHLNPRAWIDIFRQPPDWLVLGGGWQLPTVMGLSFLSPFIRNKCRIIYHLEANHHFSVYQNGPIARLRRSLLRSADALAVPGEVARITIRDYWGVIDPKFINLPNVVNEEIYKDQVKEMRKAREALRRKFGYLDSDRVILFPARLDESMKGNLNFLKAINRLNHPRLKVILAGDGPDRPKIEDWLGSHPSINAHLLGFQNSTQMIKLYALADVLALPSYRDPNPLSIIEGLWASLPILISKGCGNWPEAVDNYKNGWVINPHKQEEIRTALESIVEMPEELLKSYGQRSMEIAKQKFYSKQVAQSFISDLSILE